MMRVIRKVQPGVRIVFFQAAADALEYAHENLPEVAFISVEQEDGGGYFLIKKLRKLTPRTNIIAVSREYRFEAELMKLRISGYVTQEFTGEKVLDEMRNLRYRDWESRQHAIP